MDSLFHFIFPIIAALAARLHIKHPVRNILIAAVLAVVVDIDHFIGIPRATTTNIFVLVIVPLIFVIHTFSRKNNYNTKGLSILILIFLSSHLFLDMFSGGVALFYPLSLEYYSIEFNVPISWSSWQGQELEGLIVSSLGLGILLYFIIIILPCLFLDDIIEIMEEKHESFRKAVKDLLSQPRK